MLKKVSKSPVKSVKRTDKTVSSRAAARAQNGFNVLITGGAGFIGSNTLLYLFNKYPNYKFTVLDALTYAGDIRNIPAEIHQSPRFRFWYGDIKNAKTVDHLVSQADAVIHLMMLLFSKPMLSGPSEWLMQY